MRVLYGHLEIELYPPLEDDKKYTREDRIFNGYLIDGTGKILFTKNKKGSKIIYNPDSTQNEGNAYFQGHLEFELPFLAFFNKDVEEFELDISANGVDLSEEIFRGNNDIIGIIWKYEIKNNEDDSIVFACRSENDIIPLDSLDFNEEQMSDLISYVDDNKIYEWNNKHYRISKIEAILLKCPFLDDYFNNKYGDAWKSIFFLKEFNLS